MLRFHKQILGYQSWIGGGIGQYHRLGRTGRKSAVQDISQKALGRGDIFAPRTEAFIHLFHRLGSIGQGCPGLGAAHGVDFPDAAESGRVETGGIHLAVFVGED
jgi:hypothetical protein